MTFRGGCFEIRKYFIVLEKIKEDNCSQLNDYSVPFCERQYMLWAYLCVQIQII